jgi:hypothetical protein
MLQATETKAMEFNTAAAKAESNPAQTPSHQIQEFTTNFGTASSTLELANALVFLEQELRDREVNVKRLEDQVKLLNAELERQQKAYQELRDQEWPSSCCD